MTFERLNIRQEIIRGLKETGITHPTEIQEKAIPLIKSGKDVIGISKTGSGKTAAFGVPILDKIVPENGVQTLVISPTRELAIQISDEFKKFGKYVNYPIATVYGGVGIVPQINQIRNANIVVGTPGRLLDHLQRRTLNLSKINCFVIDEADKMVEMGFIDDVKRILEHTAENRQIILFGATISDEIDYLKRKYMKNPSIVQVESKVKEEFLEQYYYNVEESDKFSLLVHLLKKEVSELVIIFCSARSTVEIVANNLKLQGIKAAIMHGKLSQNKRQSVIENFERGRPKILVASTVASRGLDIKDITHVINYDLSQDSKEYIHRVGRTARAGESGKAITLLSKRDYDAFGEILNRHMLDVKELPKEEFERLPFKTHSGSRSGSGRFSNHRPNYGRSRGARGERGHFNRSRSSGFSRAGSEEGQRSYESSRGQGESRSRMSYGLESHEPSRRMEVGTRSERGLDKNSGNVPRSGGNFANSQSGERKSEGFNRDAPRDGSGRSEKGFDRESNQNNSSYGRNRTRTGNRSRHNYGRGRSGRR